MAGEKFVTMHFGGLELEPIEGEAAPAPKGAAVFTANTRSAPRRKGVERREQPRIQEPRRATDDRRPKKGWEKAKP